MKAELLASANKFTGQWKMSYLYTVTQIFLKYAKVLKKIFSSTLNFHELS